MLQDGCMDQRLSNTIEVTASLLNPNRQLPQTLDQYGGE